MLADIVIKVKEVLLDFCFIVGDGSINFVTTFA